MAPFFLSCICYGRNYFRVLHCITAKCIIIRYSRLHVIFAHKKINKLRITIYTLLLYQIEHCKAWKNLDLL